MKATLAGTVIRKQERRGKSGDPFAFVGLSDPTGMYEVMVFAETLREIRAVLEPGKSVLMRVVGDWNDDELKLRAVSAQDLDVAAAQAGEGLKIHLTDPSPIPKIAAELKQPGKGLITFVVPGANAQEVEIELPKRVMVSAQLKSILSSLQGVSQVETV